VENTSWTESGSDDAFVDGEPVEGGFGCWVEGRHARRRSKVARRQLGTDGGRVAVVARCGSVVRALARGSAQKSAGSASADGSFAGRSGAHGSIAGQAAVVEEGDLSLGFGAGPGAQVRGLWR
jgi:hypothetical protein